MFGKSTDKEKDLKRIEHTLDKAIELDPNPCCIRSKSNEQPKCFQTSCDEFLKDLRKAEEFGKTIDVLTIAGSVYKKCGDTQSAISLM